MHFNPYGGPAAQVAVDLANLDEQTAERQFATVRAHGMSVTEPTPRQARALAKWSARLHAVFAEPDNDVRVDMVNALLAESACRPYITRHDGKPAHIHYSGAHDDTLRRICAYTAGGLAHLLCEDGDRMGVCASDGCTTAFVDTSRNGRRRYCSTRCATRVHVAHHRERVGAQP
ncbi:CGNR zinc finger domain-containing protein [Labedaea rhizosphaerae]|uniref:Putative RNA-binding Zn ribbon-like protein n=1 Tax=Labedaea rhizosphaerae TaxID=598644 RepID=A0A4R6SCA2_LABRH|nr:CGNR zinc finger domain-containing protein [Labedaea rhizosphaerae]TDP96656.1 putative RNA-binding Zn ribbon-like protein [Labedaea rhizosphaerae]